MPSRQITEDVFLAAVDYFRAHPGDCKGCARHCGIHYRTALKWWKGEPNKLWSFVVPIRPLLEREKAQELEAEEERMEVEKERVAEEASRARKLEEQAKAFEDNALAVARADVLHGLAAINALTKGVTKLAKDVNAQLETGIDANGKALKFDIGKCLGVLKSYTTSVRGLTAAAESLVELGRVQRDLPATIMGFDLSGGVSLEDAQRQVKLAERAVKRAEALGLKTIKGGKAEAG